MQLGISRRPSAQLTLLGTRIGAKVAKAVLMSVAAGRLTPEILSEALQSSSTIRGHVQREAVKLLVVRLSLRSPQQLQWLLRLVGDCVGGLSLTGAIASLTQRSLLYQVANFGLRGSAASAITTTAVQVGLTTCTLVTTNAAFWRKGDQKMSMQQYRYELLTSFCTGVGSVAGGAVGAAVGSMVVPGVGTAFGSVLCSVGGGYIPGYLRDKKGPDDRRRQQAQALRQYTPLRMQDIENGAVLMYKEELIESDAAATAANANATATTVTRSSAVLPSVHPVDFTDSPSTDAESFSSSEEVNAEEGEIVYLDFVRNTPATPETPAAESTTSPTSSAQVEENRESSSASHPANTISGPASASCESLDRSEEGLREQETAGMRSFLCFRPSTSARSPHSASVARQSEVAPLSVASSFADLDGDDEGPELAVTGEATVSHRTERFQGYAKCITVSTEDELEAEVARFGGEDDMILVFAEKRAT